jgi:WbqC-like protein family
MIVGIHQPNYIPGLSYFAKIVACDVFILLDSVQFTKGNWTNRNRIKSGNGETMLSIPVRSKGKCFQNINKVIICNRSAWKKKHLKSIEQNYRKSNYFSEYFSLIKEIYLYDTDKLYEFNIHVIKKLCEIMGIKCEFFQSSIMKVQDFKNTDLLVDLVQQAGGEIYLSGAGGKNYIDEDKFLRANLELRLIRFDPIHYTQKYGEFLSNLSVLDLIMNEGPNSLNILKKSVRIETW